MQSWTEEKYRVINDEYYIVIFNSVEIRLWDYDFEYFSSIVESCEYNCQKMF